MPDKHELRATDHRVLILAVTVLAVILGLHLGWRALQPYASGAWANDSGAQTVNAVPALQPVSADSAGELQTHFDSAGYGWPPEQEVPPLAVQQFPDDLAEVTVDERKALFFQSLLPLLLAENARLREKRTRLQATFADGDLEVDGPDWQFVAELLYRYQLSVDPNDPETRRRLLRRVDEIPVDLALAQAANESGWGTSRFAQEANNLFGVWTWDADQGLLPVNRPEGATHYVRVFPDLQASVRNYVYTLNVGDAYHDLRQRREQLRQEGQPLQGMELAPGLVRYSERGEAYVEEVQGMIRSNGLGILEEQDVQLGAD